MNKTISTRLSNIYSDGIAAVFIFVFIVIDLLFVKSLILALGAFFSALYSTYRAFQHEVTVAKNTIIVKNIFGLYISYSINDFKIIQLKYPLFNIAEIVFLNGSSYSFFIKPHDYDLAFSIEKLNLDLTKLKVY